MFWTFLIKNVDKLGDFQTDTELQEHFLNRKLLGAAGLLNMHLSLVWVFAIAFDAAKEVKFFESSNSSFERT